MKRLLFVMSISALLTSCGYKKAELDAFDSKIKQYNAKHQLLLKPTGSGLYLKVDTIGTGRPIQLQDSIWVSYTLKLLSGKIIEVQDQAIGLPLIGSKAGKKHFTACLWVVICVALYHRNLPTARRVQIASGKIKSSILK
jgi:hypothetical protein